jgi:hypothetical protein
MERVSSEDILLRIYRNQFQGPWKIKAESLEETYVRLRKEVSDKCDLKQTHAFSNKGLIVDGSVDVGSNSIRMKFK